MEGPSIAIGALALATTLGGGYVALRLKPLEDAISNAVTAIAAVKADDEKARVALKEDFERRLTENVDSAIAIRSDFEHRLMVMHDDSKNERETMERRLSGVERSYASREELAQAINAIGSRFDRGIERMETGIKDLGTKVDSLGVRVGTIEAIKNNG